MIKNKRQKNVFFSYTFFSKSRKASHISFIISFVLFISFLIFFIGIIKPFEKAETGKSSLLKHLENEIIKEVSDYVMVISATKVTGGSKSCSEILDLIGNNIFSENNGLIKIYISNKFTLPGFSCNSQDKYEIGLIRSQKYVLESKVLNLNNSDYKTIKNDFEIPEANDFEFSLLDIDKNLIIGTKSIETPPTEVLAKLTPIIYLDENNAEIKHGYIKVVLW